MNFKKSKISKKELQREIQNEIQSEIEGNFLIPLKKDMQKSKLDVLKAKVSSQIISKDPPSNHYFVQTRHAFVSFILSYGSLLFEYLPLGAIVKLMTTCKDINDYFLSRIWKWRLEKSLRIDLDSQRLFSSEWLRNFYKSLHYSLKPSDVLSSKTLLDTQNDKLQRLTKSLVDFQIIKQPNSLQILWAYLDDFISENLMVSSEVGDERNKVTLWAINKKKTLIPFIIKEYDFPSDCQIISVKFEGENLLIIQTQEKSLEEEGSYYCKVYIMDICTEINNSGPNLLKGESCDSHKFTLQYKNNSQHESSSPSLDKINGNIEIKGYKQPPSPLNVCYDREDRLFFYSQTSNTFFLPYNLRTFKLENPYISNLGEHFQLVVIPRHCFSIDYIDMVLIGRYNRTLLKYNKLSFLYTRNGITRNFHNNYDHAAYENLGTQKFQYGSFTGPDDLMVEYIFIMDFGTLYFLRLHDLSFKRLSKEAPDKKYKQDYNFRDFLNQIESCTKGKGKITNWYAYKDLLVVTFGIVHFYIIKFDSDGKVTKIMEDKSIIRMYSKWETHMKKKNVTPIDCHFRYPLAVFNLSETASYIFINDSYFIVIFFSKYSKNFHIHFTSLPEILMKKNPRIWSVFRRSELNLRKMEWSIQGDCLVPSSINSFFQNCYNCQYVDLVKFQENKILIKFQGMSLFFDLETNQNFSKSVIRGLSEDQILNEIYSLDFNEIPVKEKEIKTFENGIVIEKKVPSVKNRNLKLVPNKNHKNRQGDFYNQGVDEGFEDFRETEQKEEEGEKNSQKQFKRKQIRNFLSKVNKSPELASFAYLKPDTNKKEWFLREMNKKKDKTKRTNQGYESS